MDCDNCENIETCRFEEEGRMDDHCNFYLPVKPPTSEAPVDMLVSRDEFEKWVLEMFLCTKEVTRDGDGYTNSYVNAMWLSWKARSELKTD